MGVAARPNRAKPLTWRTNVRIMSGGMGNWGSARKQEVNEILAAIEYYLFRPEASRRAAVEPANQVIALGYTFHLAKQLIIELECRLRRYRRQR